MSSYSLNTTLSSYVSEQAYFPLCSPDRGCVLREGEKGSFCSKTSTSESFLSSSEEFLTSLWAHRIKCFSKTRRGKLFFPVSDGIHCVFNRIESYSIGFFFDFLKTLFKCLAFFLFLKKILDKIFRFAQGRHRKHRKHFFDLFHFVDCRFHVGIIAREGNFSFRYLIFQVFSFRFQQVLTRNLRLKNRMLSGSMASGCRRIRLSAENKFRVTNYIERGGEGK